METVLLTLEPLPIRNYHYNRVLLFSVVMVFTFFNSAKSQLALYNQISAIKNFYETPYFYNPSFIGLNNNNEINSTIQRGNTGRLYALGKRFEHYANISAIFCNKDSLHKPSLLFIAEYSTPNSQLRSETAYSLSFAYSYIIKHIEIRPSMVYSVRYDFENLPKIYDARPSVFDSIKPLLPRYHLSNNVGASILILFNKYKLGLSIKNVFKTNIPIESTHYNTNRILEVNFSRTFLVHILNRTNLLEPYMFINIFYINGQYVQGFISQYYRHSNYNQCNFGMHIIGKRMIKSIRMGVYPQVLIGFRPYSSNWNEENLKPKEFGVSIGRRFSNIEFIYNVDYVSVTSSSVLEFNALQNVKYSSLSFKYRF